MTARCVVSLVGFYLFTRGAVTVFLMVMWLHARYKLWLSVLKVLSTHLTYQMPQLLKMPLAYTLYESKVVSDVLCSAHKALSGKFVQKSECVFLTARHHSHNACAPRVILVSFANSIVNYSYSVIFKNW